MIANRFDCFKRENQPRPIGSVLVFPNGLTLLTLPSNKPHIMLFNSVESLKSETGLFLKFIKRDKDWEPSNVERLRRYVTPETLDKFNELIT